jgi:hypothetical protein
MHPYELFRRLDRKREFPVAPAPSARSCSNITMSDRPARTLHDAGDHRTVERWCHCQPSGNHQLICPALAGQRGVPPPATPRWGTRSGRERRLVANGCHSTVLRFVCWSRKSSANRVNSLKLISPGWNLEHRNQNPVNSRANSISLLNFRLTFAH